MKISFNEEQIELLNKIGIDFNLKGSLSEDDIFDIDDKVADHLIYFGIGDNDEVNEVGLICESILELLSE